MRKLSKIPTSHHIITQNTSSIFWEINIDQLSSLSDKRGPLWNYLVALCNEVKKTISLPTTDTGDWWVDQSMLLKQTRRLKSLYIRNSGPAFFVYININIFEYLREEGIRDSIFIKMRIFHIIFVFNFRGWFRSSYKKLFGPYCGARYSDVVKSYH